jgi:hypothetical protein
VTRNRRVSWSNCWPHEDHRRGKPNAQNADGGSRNPLSRFQITYARKPYKQGAPVRPIGLIFQLSPDVVLELVARSLGKGLDTADQARAIGRPPKRSSR